MTKRGLDHIVHAVHGMDRARDVFGQMGFTLTPVNHHPFGTFNSIVQFQGSFLELLAVEDPDLIPSGEPGAFNFARFNFLYLERHEGVSMLVVESKDAEADAAMFATDNLQAYTPFEFKRKAPQPDGSAPIVGFRLAFASHPFIPEAGFFACQQLAPKYFWKEAFQTHENSAIEIDEVVMIADEPVDFHRFFQSFTGERDIRSTSMGLSVPTPRGTITLLTHQGAETIWGDAIDVANYDTPRFAAYVIAVADLKIAEQCLKSGEINYQTRGDMLVVPAKEGFGAAIAFRERRS